MANCKQTSSLSGVIYQEATIGKRNPHGRICVKISIPEDGGPNDETTWHNCYYFTSSDAEVEFLRKKLVPRAVVHMQGRYTFRKKRHDTYPVDIMVPGFYVDTLSVLHSPVEDSIAASSGGESDPFLDDEPPVTSSARAPVGPSRPSQVATHSAQAPRSAPAPRQAPEPAPAASVTSAVPLQRAAAGGSYPAPVLDF